MNALHVNKTSTVLFGADVSARLSVDRSRKVTPSSEHADCWESESLCRWQSEIHALGFLTAILEKSSLGWSVRNGSGLDGFTLIASVRDGQLDGSFADAERFARVWQSMDSHKRVVIVNKSEDRK